MSLSYVFNVLIVPSGIETCFTDFPVSFLIVLIVPSGIETELHFKYLERSEGINCT